MKQNNRLAAKVSAVNRANQKANLFYLEAVKAFAPFLGKQLYKADGSFLAKVAAIVPRLEPGDYCYNSSFSLLFVMKEFRGIEGESGGIYGEGNCYVGNLTNGVLNNFLPPPNLRTDYTVEEITKLRQEVETAESILSAAKSKLGRFGAYDN